MMNKYVLVLTGIILTLLVANHTTIAHLNEYMQLNECSQRRVKEPKIVSPFIAHEAKLSIDVTTPIRYDGTVYISILIHSILTLVLCVVLVVVVTVVFFVCNYLIWWALLIAIGYNIMLWVIHFYYWLKFKKANKK